MSIQAMAWVLKQEIGDSTAKLVLLCLANYAGEGGENAFPSVARLQSDTELSERTIRSKLDLLVEKHFIKLGNQQIAVAFAKRRDRATVCYDFIIRGASPAPRESDGVQMTTPRGARPAPNPEEIRKRSGTRARARTVKEVLAAQERPPEGRETTFEAEFERRFGCKPDTPPDEVPF